MPSDIDEMVQHGNFEQVFEIVRGSKSSKKLRGMLLDSLYGFRSQPVHEGLAMAYEGFGLSGSAGPRRMFASWFAESAILRYLDSPRTSLIGHPVTAAGQEKLDPGSGRICRPDVTTLPKHLGVDGSRAQMDWISDS
jgi:hypothetical protein